MLPITKRSITLLVVLFLLQSSTALPQSASKKTEASKLKTLIVDGQNNHEHWPKITYMVKSYLEGTGMFTVDVARTAFTWQGEKYLKEFAIEGSGNTEVLDAPKADPDYKPDFSTYDLVVCNFGWRAAPWPDATQKAFEDFIQNGGGLVVIHAADNSFPEWKAYNEMIGLGGWGDRTEKSGPYVYYNDKGELVRDTSAGKGGEHGPEHEFIITVRNSKHPITKGMPMKWLHGQDELYGKLRGPAENMEILATAYSSTDYKGSGRHEPMLMTLNFGKGRIFHTPMGHADYSAEDVGFITCLLRGAEWAATGKVTQKIPKDFPTKDKTSSRPFRK